MTRGAPKLAIWALISLLIGSALLLIAGRGSAIVLDLSAAARGFLCL